MQHAAGSCRTGTPLACMHRRTLLVWCGMVWCKDIGRCIRSRRLGPGLTNVQGVKARDVDQGSGCRHRKVAARPNRCTHAHGTRVHDAQGGKRPHTPWVGCVCRRCCRPPLQACLTCVLLATWLHRRLAQRRPFDCCCITARCVLKHCMCAVPSAFCAGIVVAHAE